MVLEKDGVIAEISIDSAYSQQSTSTTGFESDYGDSSFIASSRTPTECSSVQPSQITANSDSSGEGSSGATLVEKLKRRKRFNRESSDSSESSKDGVRKIRKVIISTDEEDDEIIKEKPSCSSSTMGRPRKRRTITNKKSQEKSGRRKRQKSSSSDEDNYSGRAPSPETLQSSPISRRLRTSNAVTNFADYFTDESLIDTIRHDESGNIVINNSVKCDLCDCLSLDCTGCFMPCSKCSGRKCGPICRRRRDFIVYTLTNSSKNSELKNPFFNKLPSL